MKKYSWIIWLLVAIAYLFGHLLLSGCAQAVLISMGILGAVVTMGNIVTAANYYQQANEQRFWSVVFVAMCVGIVAVWDIYRAGSPRW